MKNLIFTTLLALSLSMIGAAQTPIGEMQFTEGAVQHIVRSADIEWRPCPPNMPSGCEIVVLEGNPQGSGMFTIRFRVTEPFFMPAHAHPKDERVTVIKGKAYVAFGIESTKEDAQVFVTGDYYVNAREAVHKVWADPSTIIQLTGIGPWEANFVEVEKGSNSKN